MSEQEQNAKINQLRRQLGNAVERIKALELGLEPEGRINRHLQEWRSHSWRTFGVFAIIRHKRSKLAPATK